MEPLTPIDARHPATVARWLDTWHQAAWLVHPDRLALDAYDGGCLVSMSADGLWTSATYAGATRSHVQHADRAALVTYVNAWARGI
jgi:hypothetical protein